MTAAWRTEGPWREQAAHQSDVITCSQLRAAGWSEADLEVARRFAPWRPLGDGVHALHQGPLPPAALAWAELLRCGEGAALASWSALAAWGLRLRPGRLDTRFHVAIPRRRRVRDRDTVCVHRRLDHDEAVHPAADPPRQRIEIAVLEAAAECERSDDVAGVVLGALSKRATTAARLAEHLSDRGRHRWGSLLRGVLADAEAGVASVLEREYLRRVHRAHRLPPARFNAADVQDGGRVYRDAEYDRGLVVELDGLAFHDASSLVVDRRRDNELTVQGRRSLRFGWAEVVGWSCAVAATVIRALRGLGVDVSACRPCGPSCTAVPALRGKSTHVRRG